MLSFLKPRIVQGEPLGSIPMLFVNKVMVLKGACIDDTIIFRVKTSIHSLHVAVLLHT